MRKDRSIAALLAIVLFSALARAQAPAPTSAVPRPAEMPAGQVAESLFSPSAADQFWELGREIVFAQDVTEPQIARAIIFLTAAKTLNRELPVEPLLLRLVTRRPQKDRSEQVLYWLDSYVSASADRTVVMDAIRYLLNRVNSREERIALLSRLIGRIGNRNAALDSEMETLLGMLMVEKADFATAKRYLVQAYTNNKYNKLAFAKLAELVPNEIGPGVYLERLRLAVREDPLDFNAALAFAQYAERLELYEVAASSYQYCAELFRYLYPSEPLPPHVYLPWAVTCYNTERGRPTCLQIAANVRNMGRFDILLEAIAGRAAARMGRAEEAQRIFRLAEQKAQSVLSSEASSAAAATASPGPAGAQATTPSAPQVNTRQLAWFYCFADPNPEKALDWANKAYAAEPNAPSVAALLAYAFSLSNQLEWARPLLGAAQNSQIADLVQAKIEVSEGKKEDARTTLTAAITKDAGSLAAERAREMLHDLGGEYVPSINPNQLLTFLTGSLGRAVAPQFLPPNQMLDVQFSIRGSEFSYGSELEATLTIANKSTESLLITDGSLFRGNIRVSASVNGDIKQEIPDLLVQTMRTELAVAPGRSMVQVLRLSTGALRRLLLTYPQASLDIRFTLYLDPMAGTNGVVANRLTDIKPITVSIHRPGVEVTAKSVRERFNAISSGQEVQKIRTARLFTGLLKEQYAMAEHGTLYPFKYATWLAELLRSALVSDSGLLLCDGGDAWVVRVNAMADLLSLPLDQGLAAVIAKNLNHPQWPVRLMAVYVLADGAGGGFDKVLDWVAQSDTNELVRGIALSLQPAPAATTTPATALLPTAASRFNSN
jgi:tetratricopeptide (TPR) repeat protein